LITQKLADNRLAEANIHRQAGKSLPEPDERPAMQDFRIEPTDRGHSTRNKTGPNSRQFKLIRLPAPSDGQAPAAGISIHA